MPRLDDPHSLDALAALFGEDWPGIPEVAYPIIRQLYDRVRPGPVETKDDDISQLEYLLQHLGREKTVLILQNTLAENVRVISDTLTRLTQLSEASLSLLRHCGNAVFCDHSIGEWESTLSDFTELGFADTAEAPALERFAIYKDTLRPFLVAATDSERQTTCCDVLDHLVENDWVLPESERLRDYLGRLYHQNRALFDAWVNSDNLMNRLKKVNVSEEVIQGITLKMLHQIIRNVDRQDAVLKLKKNQNKPALIAKYREINYATHLKEQLSAATARTPDTHSTSKAVGYGFVASLFALSGSALGTCVLVLPILNAVKEPLTQGAIIIMALACAIVVGLGTWGTVAFAKKSHHFSHSKESVFCKHQRKAGKQLEHLRRDYARLTK